MSTNQFLNDCFDKVTSGGKLQYSDAIRLAKNIDPAILIQKADELRKLHHGQKFDLCSIINAKSGKCSEDCRFCAQSSHYSTDIAEYSAINKPEAIRQGRDNESNGVRRFSLVTAGKAISSSELDNFSEIYTELGAETNLELCASMGMLTHETASKLYSMGVRRYHCNLEACREYFPKICSSHTWEEKVDTIKHARSAGMDVCSGGIFGIGESAEHRIKLAFELSELKVMSIPINILVPIRNTPLEDIKPISLEEVLRSIAVFRFINPKAIIRLAGGRNQFRNDQYRCFEAGANGAIVGNYLTTTGNSLKEDLINIKQLGFDY